MANAADKTGIQLTKVRIQHFRGIVDITVDLGQNVVLIGENNTGKTSFLHAIQLCLQRVRSARGGAFDTYDLHFSDRKAGPSTAQPIIVTLTFSEQAPEQWADDVVQALSGLTSFDDDDRQVLVVEVKGEPNQADGTIETSWKFLDTKGKELNTKEARSRASLSTVQELAPVFYLTALRDAATNFAARGKFWRPFLNEAGVDPARRDEISQALQEVNTLVIEHHKSLGKVKDRLTGLRDLIASADAADVSIEAVSPRIFDLLSRAQVSLTAPGGAPVPLERHGDGTQSLAVLLLFDAFLKAKLEAGTSASATPILALEEPEAHLHPAATRSLYRVLRDLDGQKLISTHSGDLLAEVEIGHVRRFTRREGQVVVSRVPDGALSPEEVRKFNHHVRRSRGELLFARCWLLVEGETEVTIFDAVSRVMGQPLDAGGVRIIEFAHVGIDPLIKVADALGIPWYAVCDGDSQGEQDAKKVRTNLKGRVEADHLTRWNHRNIEVVLSHLGYGDIYERAVPQATVDQRVKEDKWASAKDPNYWDVVAGALSTKLKVPCAQEVVAQMESKGKADLPDVLKSVVKSVLDLTVAP